MADRVGEKLGNYRLVRLLGQGGFAEVYLGEHIYLDTQAAIKVLHTQLAHDGVEQFRLEAKRVAHLEHPHIVRVLDFGVEGTTPFLVMSYASGGTLRQRHPRGTRLPLPLIVQYVKQVADALQYAHDEKFIHRDIKPENMLLGRRNDVMLSDFGIATIVHNTTSLSVQAAVGTVPYMAPEQLQEHPRPASDQYALGVVVYEWLCGDRPFDGSFTEIVVKHLTMPPPPLRERMPVISPEVEQVVMTVLAKDYRQRFGSMQAFARALEQASEVGPTRVVPPPWRAEPPVQPVLPPLSGAGNEPGLPARPPNYLVTPGNPSLVPMEMPGPMPSSAAPMGMVTPATPVVDPTVANTPAGQTSLSTDAVLHPGKVSPPGEVVTPPYASTKPSPSTWTPVPPPPPPARVPDTRTFAPIAPARQRTSLFQRPRSTVIVIVLSLLTIVALVVGLVLSQNHRLPGLGGSLTPTTQTNGGIVPVKAPADQQIVTLPEAGVSDLTTFDPGLASDSSSVSAIDMVFTGLVQLDDHLMVQPQLAASYSVAPDGLTWTFHLRPNLKFSDGTPLTSEDVAYSINRALLPAEKSVYAPYYLALVKDSDKLVAGQITTLIGDSLRIPDATTIVIITNKKAPYFLDALTYPTSYVVEQSVIKQWGTTWTDHLADNGGQGGDGPFKVKEFTHGKQIVFVPNPNYNGPMPQVQQVVYPFFSNASAAYNAYQAGQLDETTVPAAQLATARQLTKEFHQVPQLQINYYAMNYLVKPFDNIKIRQAFELAINKDLIVHNIWQDSLIATNHIVPAAMPGYNPNLTGPDGVKGTSGDPTQARSLFQAGLREEGLTLATLPPITLTYVNNPTTVGNEVSALQQMWQSVLGVSVKTASVDFTKLLTQINGATNNPHGLQFWGISWIADYPDPQDWTTLQFDKGSPNNNMNFGQNTTSGATQQQATQQALEAADVNPDQNARLQQYMSAEQQLVNDVAWLPMEQNATTFLLKPYVQGIVFNAEDLIPPNDWSRIYISVH